MKKFIVFATCLLFLFCLISCTDYNKDNANIDSASSSSSAQAEASSEVVSEITSSESSKNPLSAESEQALKDEMSRLIDELLFDD
ncbi:MAG TPA: hypothetical protein PLD48_05575 [Bacillota bacterium]|nr:hypothetical protein [Bacillota bacterium]HOK67990.1 hypothetical protein [Bacillota bacterium]HPP84536.1 hypothetical protein [Bacillota bacterium]